MDISVEGVHPSSAGVDANPNQGAQCDEVIVTEEPIAVYVWFRSTGFPGIPIEVGLQDSDSTQLVQSAAAPIAFDFGLGFNTLVGTTTDPAGNTSELSCSFFVGDPPIVTWFGPTRDVGVLNGADAPPSDDSLQDSDELADGWQGVLEVQVENLKQQDLDQATVQFYANDEPLGDAIELASAPGGGMSGDRFWRTVILDLAAAGLAIPENRTVTLRAEVFGAKDPANALLRNLLVDVTPPDEPESVVPQVGPNPGDRRQTRFQLKWEAPADGEEGRVASYAIAYDTMPITDLADFESANPVDFTTTRQLPEAPSP